MKWWILALLLIITACSSPTENTIIPIGETHEIPLQIPLKDTLDLREEFKQEINQTRINTPDQREVYEKYITLIGANGMKKVIHKLHPLCHDEAHEFGKVIFSEVKEVAPSLAACDQTCFSGCMHGVFMEAFEKAIPSHEHEESGEHPHHLETTNIAPLLPKFCDQESIDYKKGDCAHGIGHALMAMSYYNIEEAVESCQNFEDPILTYYCATGGYMEYTNKYTEVTKDNLFHPCEEAKYPAACYRYKMPKIFHNLSKEMGPKVIPFIVNKCLEMDGFQRLGCFHGYGNAHVGHIRIKRFTIAEICKFGTDDDKIACIEGVIERLGKYTPKLAPPLCDSLEGDFKEICLAGAEGKMYRLDKDFRLYFQNLS